MWAAGIITFEMLTGKLPFKSGYKKTTIDQIMYQDIDFEGYDLSIEAKSLLVKMLEKNP